MKNGLFKIIQEEWLQYIIPRTKARKILAVIHAVLLIIGLYIFLDITMEYRSIFQMCKEKSFWSNPLSIVMISIFCEFIVYFIAQEIQDYRRVNKLLAKDSRRVNKLLADSAKDRKG